MTRDQVLARHGTTTAEAEACRGWSVDERSGYRSRGDWRPAVERWRRSRADHLLASGMIVVLALRSHDDLLFPALAFVVVVGVLLARIDVAVRRLPFAITVPAFAASFVLLIPATVVDGRQLAVRALGSAVGWLTFYGVIAAVTRGRGMGWGDVVLAPTLGLVLGAISWESSLVGILAGFWLAAFPAIRQVLSGTAHRRSGLAFGPFMLAGAALAAIAGDAIAGAVGAV